MSAGPAAKKQKVNPHVRLCAWSGVEYLDKETVQFSTKMTALGTKITEDIEEYNNVMLEFFDYNTNDSIGPDSITLGSTSGPIKFKIETLGDDPVQIVNLLDPKTKTVFYTLTFNNNFSSSGSRRDDTEKTNASNSITRLLATIGATLKELSEVERVKTATGLDTAFKAWFCPTMILEKTDTALRGKLVSELAARNILDSATVSGMDVQDAMFRLISYANQNPLYGVSDDQKNEDKKRLIEQLFQFERNPVPALIDDTRYDSVVRRGILQQQKRITPLDSILKTKLGADAASSADDARVVDANTREFERDQGRSDAAPDVLTEHVTRLLCGVFASLFATDPVPRVLNSTKTSNDIFGEGSEEKREKVSPATFLYTGKESDFIGIRENFAGPMSGEEMGKKEEEEKAKRAESVALVERILRGGTIPMYSGELGGTLMGRFMKNRSVRDILGQCTDPMVLSRVEHARECEVEYKIISVNYGTGESSEYVGTGTNVTMLTDCAFIAARIIYEMYEKLPYFNHTSPSGTQDLPYDPRYWFEPFEMSATDFISHVPGFTAAQLKKIYTGHCTVRPGDLGRIISASVIQPDLPKAIKETAVDAGYTSIKEGIGGDADGNLRKLYHAIWAKELGAHAVAQGNARLLESHMIVPFFVRATSDSEHVVPTIMAVDDFIGPTDEFERLEQVALMELENYAKSRPSVVYRAGGVPRSHGDIASLIRDGAIGTDAPLEMINIIGKAADGFQEKAITCCAMLMIAVRDHRVFTSEVRTGGLARQKGSETEVRSLAERVGCIKAR